MGFTRKMILLLFAASAAFAASATPREFSTWQVMPICGGGNFHGVRFCPSDPKVLYCYVDMGGPYRSDDGGLNWRALNAVYTPAERLDLVDQPRGLSVDPRNADSILIATGNRFERPGGVYVSHDGGKTVRRTLTARFYGDSPSRRDGLAIDRNPFDPDEIIAGEDWDGISFSRDNGETWTKLGLEEHWFNDIRFDRSVRGRIWATARPHKPNPRFAAYKTRKTGFYRSDDLGRTWTKLPVADPPSEICQIPGERRVVAIWTDDRVMASDDAGETWFDFSQGLPKITPEKLKKFFLVDAKFEAIAAGPDFYILGAEYGDLFRRGKGDATWSVVRRESSAWGVPEKEDHMMRAFARDKMWHRCSFSIDPHDPDHWFQTDWFDIWETRDAGRTWTTRVNGIMPLVSFCLKCDPFDARKVLYGVADVEMLATTNDCRTFFSPAHHPYGECITHSAKTPGLVFGCGAKQTWQTFALSRDGGVSWTNLSDAKGLPRGMKPHGIAAYAVTFDPLSDDLYIAVSGPCEPGKGGVYVSRDLGTSWTWFSQGLPRGKPLFKDFEWTDGPCQQFATSADGTVLLRAPKVKRLYRLHRDWGVWEEVKVETEENVLPTPDPFVPGRFLWAGKAMRESTDGGRTYHPYPGPAGCRNMGIAFDAHCRGRVAFCTPEAILLSRDGGRTCTRLDGWLEAVPSGCQRRIVLDRGRMFFLTEGTGVWRRDLEDAGCGEEKASAVTDRKLEEQWVHSYRSWFALPQQFESMMELVPRAKKAGYTGICFMSGRDLDGNWGLVRSNHDRTDRFVANHIGIDAWWRVSPARQKRFLAFKEECDRNGLDFVPFIWSLGYGGAATLDDPNLASVWPVREVPYVAKGGRAVYAGGETVGAAALAALLRRNEGKAIFGGSARFGVSPARRYRVSCEVQTENLAVAPRVPIGGVMLSVRTANEALMLGSKQPYLKPTQDWTPIEFTFNSFDETNVLLTVTCGANGGGRKALGFNDEEVSAAGGRFRVRALKVDELGIEQPVVREGAPFAVRRADTGTACGPGTDYTPPKTPRHITFSGPCEPVSFPVAAGIPEGTRLLVSSYEPIYYWGMQNSLCLTTPGFDRWIERSARALSETFGLKKWLISADEIRNECRCETCVASGCDVGTRFARAVTRMRATVKALCPDADIYMFADQVDPNHNAEEHCCGCHTPFTGCWNLMPKDVIMCPWYGGKCETCIAFLDSQGFRTHGFGYYDKPTDEQTVEICTRWRDALLKAKGGRGLTYTSWKNGNKGGDFSRIELWADTANGKNGRVESVLPKGHTFKLVWSDEFDGDRLDETKWSYRTNFWAHPAHWFAKPEDGCVSVRDGMLHLTLKKLPNGVFVAPQLQTGELMWDIPRDESGDGFWLLPPRAPVKFEHRYGYYECRARLQQYPGWWSAFWMQSAAQGATLHAEYSGIEHDIMESFEPGEIIPSYFHYDGCGVEHKSMTTPDARTSPNGGTNFVDKTAFHLFGLLWEPDGYTVYIDGRPRGPKLTKVVSQVPEFLLLTTETKWYRRQRLKGKGVPELEAAAAAGDEFIVDHVRVYDIVD